MNNKSDELVKVCQSNTLAIIYIVSNRKHTQPDQIQRGMIEKPEFLAIY